MPNDFDSLSTRIDEIENEIKSGRISNTGIVYSNIGNAIRMSQQDAFMALDITESVAEDVEHLKNNLNDFINIEQVDGLHYEDNFLFLTKNGVITGDGVKIVGGGGGDGTGSLPSASAVSIDILDFSNTFYVAEGAPATIQFTYTSKFDPNGKGTCKLYKKGNGTPFKVIEVTSKTPTNPIDISEALSDGYNEIEVQCVDKYNNSLSVYYYITVVSLRLVPKFSNNRIYTNEFSFEFDQYGEGDKTVYFILDKGKTTETTITKIIADEVESKQFETIPFMGHGVHTLEVYMESNKTMIPTPSHHYTIGFADTNNPEPIIVSNCSYTKVKQSDSLKIPFIVYDKDKEKKQVQLKVEYIVGTSNESIVTTQEVTNGMSEWEVTGLPTGSVKLTIEYIKNYTPKFVSFTIEVEEDDRTISPVSGRLSLSVAAAGKSNNDTDRDKWYYDGENVATLSNFNWKSNGWVKDSNGDTCLRVTGGASVDISNKPFSSDTEIKEYGKTIEIEFAIRDVNSRLSEVIRCYDSDSSLGIICTPDAMSLKTSSEKVQCNFVDNRRVRVGFVIYPNTSTNTFIQVFLNGVLSGAKYYSSTDETFLQKTPQNISIGSSGCGIDIYSIRVYDRYLSPKEMLLNYIADLPNMSDKLTEYNNNIPLYNKEGSNLLYSEVKKRIPTITFVGKMPEFKGDKRPKKDAGDKIIPSTNVRMIFEHPENDTLNFDELVKQIDVQGTSSQYYVRKNWKTKHNSELDPNPIEGELPAKVFCIKVDYAESTGTHNTQSANLIETFYDALPIPPKKVPDGYDLTSHTLDTLDDVSKIRTTISGFPIVIFHVDTDDVNVINNPNIVADIEEGKYNAVFSSKGNFNYDKGAEDVFAFNDDFTVECWEFLKNEDPQSFLTPWPDLPLNYWEPRYHKDLGDLEDKLDAIEDLPDDEKAEEFKKINEDEDTIKMFRRFKSLYEWVHSTARGEYNTDNTRSLGEDVLIDGKSYSVDNDEYRLAKFKSEFTNYFNLDYCAIYYVYTFFALMVDQRAKNMFLTYWPDKAYDKQQEDEEDEAFDARNPGHWYPYFYDNDTCFGISNKGHLDFDYYHQDSDSIGGSAVYNGANSILWTNFRDAFQSKISSTYKQLRDNKISYDKIINRFITKGSKVWPAAVYNQDAKYKYIDAETAKDETGKEIVDDNGKTVAFPYLYQVRGNGEQHLEYFIKNRLKFCDSKWKCGDYSLSSNKATFTIYNPTTAPSYKLCDRMNDIISDFNATDEEFNSLSDENKSYISSGAPFTDAMISEIKGFVSSYKKIKASIEVSPPSASISITPFTRMYYTVEHGASSGAIKNQITKLATNTTDELLFSTNGAESINDFELAVYGAPDVSSLGDLSNLYAKTVNVSQAIKLTTLRIGNENDGYYNPNLTSLSLGNNTLLQSINVANCPNLSGTLNLSSCSNISYVDASGTSITAVSLPVGGYVQTLKLPSTIESLYLVGQASLTNSGIILDNNDFSNVKKLMIDGCQNIEPLEILDKCSSVQYARLTGVDLGDVTIRYLTEELPNIKFLGADGSISNDSHLYIEGRCKIVDEQGNSIIKGSDMKTLKSMYTDLLIEYDEMELDGIKFVNYDGTVLYEPTGIKINGGDSDSTISLECPVSTGKIEKPTKPSTIESDYTFIGWSRVEGATEVQEHALDGVNSSVTLYAVYSSSPAKHEIKFYDGSTWLKTVVAEYGSYPDFGGEPKKTGVDNPDLFDFIKWYPELSIVKGEAKYYAQFDVVENGSIREITLGELSFLYENGKDTAIVNDYHFGNVIENGKISTVGRLSDTYNIDGKDYTIVGVENLGGNNSSDICGMELMILPDTVTTIGKNAFAYSNLLAITIPKNVTSISETAFNYCSKLTEINCRGDESTSKYIARENCLIDKSKKSVIAGCYNSIIPDDENVVTKIGQYAFKGSTSLTSISIPKNITEISGGAFTDCENLTSIVLPSNCKTFGAMCLYGTGLSSVEFPITTKTIGMYAVKECDRLTDITIWAPPTTLTDMNNQALVLSDSTGPVIDCKLSLPNWKCAEAKSKQAPWGMSNNGHRVTVECNDGNLIYENGILTQENSNV